MRNLRDHPEVYKPFLIIVFVSLVQQFSGVSVIRAYSVSIFDTVFSQVKMMIRVSWVTVTRVILRIA